MKSAPKPAEEVDRLEALRALDVLDTPPEAEFDALVKAASAVCGTPISLVSLVDADRQWFKANHGLDGARETSRDLAFCAHAILGDELLEVRDAALDERFADNALVTGEPRIRFYAGAPVRLSNGHRVGTLCVIDRQPRALSDEQRGIMQQLSQAVARALEGRQALRRIRAVMTELEGQRALLDATLCSIDDSVITTDAAGRVTWANPAAERLLDRPAGRWIGRDLHHAIDLRDGSGQRMADKLLRSIADGRPTRLADDAVLRRSTGARVAVSGVASALRRDDRLEGAVLVLRDTSTERRAAREIAHRASHDPLTGLVNRGEFEARLTRMIHEDAAGALLFIDLDHFKIVNDRCGHAAGDDVLRQFARMLRESVRASDTVARLGGDEFAVLLARCPLTQARRTGERICDRLERYRFVHGDQRFRIGASIGAVPLGGPLNDVRSVLQAADGCAYAAKSAGRNRVVALHEAPAAPQSASDAMWAEQLERALDEDRFVLFGQRVVPLRADAGVTKVEVLLRLPQADGSLASPGAFMPAAERFHLMGRIDRWVARKVLDWMSAWRFDGVAQRVGINLSGQSLADASFRDWLLQALDAAGAPLRQRLTVEITETVALACLDEAAAFVRQLQAVGVRVALDDFGAGAAGFGYLKSLPVNYLKIDGHFIRNLLTDPLDQAAVKCFVEVARLTGVRTVAEFVESAAVLDRLTALGVDFAQGFLLHRPEPLALAAGREQATDAPRVEGAAARV